MQLADLYHPDYADAAVGWQAIEDVCAGPRTVKRRGKIYLPELSGQTQEEYDSFKRRAVLFNATKRTREAMVGMLLRKAPRIKVPAAEEPYTADVDLEGSSWRNWVRKVIQQAVSTGRSVTVVDWNETEKRPYLAFYPGVNVCNWAVERVNGRNELSLLTLKETTEVRQGSTVTKQEQFRQYTLDDGKVMVVVWRVGTNGEMSQDAAQPLLRKGKALTRIPAVFHNADHLGPAIGEAPLSDICELNLAHYMGSADLWNGRHICGIPTPYATGVEDSNSELKLGSTNAWTASDPQARFGFIEFTGTGLGALVTGQEELERQMAVLGARMLFESKGGVEAADTVRMRSASEHAALANISGFLSASLTQALRWFVWWNGTIEEPSKLPDDVGILVNHDFLDIPLPPAALTALVAAFQADAISYETLFHQLQTGELYPEDWDMEREIAAIAQRPPATVPKVEEKPDPTADPDDDETKE